jgi:hypothetical protein
VIRVRLPGRWVALDAVKSEEIDELDESSAYLLDMADEGAIEKRRELLKAACRHDWLYRMSDDQRVWSKGRLAERAIREMFDELRPPFSINELMCHVLDHVEDLAEEQQHMPPRITAQLRGEIESWFPSANEASGE